MIHLTKNEIMKFVSFNRLDAASLEFAGKVNTHLRECPECRKRVIAYQKINDLLTEFTSMDNIENMEKIEKIMERVEKAEPEAEMEMEME